LVIQELLLFFAAYPFTISTLGAFVGGEETILVIAFLAGQGVFGFWTIFVGSILGTVLSDLMWFYIGRSKFANKLLRWKHFKTGYKKAKNILDKLVQKNTFITLVVGKFIYGTRIATITYLSRERLSITRFSLYNSIVILIWLAVVVPVGWLAGKGFSNVLNVYKNVEHTIAVIVLFVIAAYAVKLVVDKWVLRRIKSA